MGTETDGGTSMVTGSTGTTEAPIPAAKLRLPGDITPSLYQVKIDPYLDEPDPDGNNFTFRGTVSIVVHCVKTTSKVTLHSKKLQIGEDVTISIYNETFVTDSPVTASGTTLSAITLPSTTAGNNTSTNQTGKFFGQESEEI